MRPPVHETSRGDFECFGCGHRDPEPDDRFCPKCGSEMRNTGRSRDL